MQAAVAWQQARHGAAHGLHGEAHFAVSLQTQAEALDSSVHTRRLCLVCLALDQFVPSREAGRTLPRGAGGGAPDGGADHQLT